MITTKQRILINAAADYFREGTNPAHGPWGEGYDVGAIQGIIEVLKILGIDLKDHLAADFLDHRKKMITNVKGGKN